MKKTVGIIIGILVISSLGLKSTEKVNASTTAAATVSADDKNELNNFYKKYRQQIIEKKSTKGSVADFSASLRAMEKPTVEKMEQDLVGHTLTEGVTNGYHHAEWTYTITAGSVSGFQITETIEDNDSEYIVLANVMLKGSESEMCNFVYETAVRMRYFFSQTEGWKLDYITSLGMSVGADSQYLHMIQAQIVDDGWGGVNCLNLRNNGEFTLVVGGMIYTYDGWKKFAVQVAPHQYETVGGTFGGGTVEDYVIQFVVREF